MTEAQKVIQNIKSGIEEVCYPIIVGNTESFQMGISIKDLYFILNHLYNEYSEK